ncbi:MAG: hypothetical protein CYG61_05700 [Actinobacteria bacterium]|nr:MAG: hypothetical protein CYG61_05700 [Actinomycetota bacterium]
MGRRQGHGEQHALHPLGVHPHDEGRRWGRGLPGVEPLQKKGHRNQEQITCTFGDTFTENGETFTFSGTATVVKKP